MTLRILRPGDVVTRSTGRSVIERAELVERKPGKIAGVQRRINWNVKVAKPIGWREAIDQRRSRRIELIPGGAIATYRYERRAWVGAEHRTVCGWRSDPIKLGQIKLIGDDKSGIAEDNEIDSVTVQWVVQYRSAKSQSQRTSGPNRDQLTWLKRGIERIDRPSEWVRCHS